MQCNIHTYIMYGIFKKYMLSQCFYCRYYLKCLTYLDFNDRIFKDISDIGRTISKMDSLLKGLTQRLEKEHKQNPYANSVMELFLKVSAYLLFFAKIRNIKASALESLNVFSLLSPCSFFSFVLSPFSVWNRKLNI